MFSRFPWARLRVPLLRGAPLSYTPAVKLCLSTAAAVSVSLAIQYPLSLDAPPPLTFGLPTVPEDVPERVDPATSISFPETLRIPSKQNYPNLTLLGLGVRTVSFLRVKVYSIGFYADLKNPNLRLDPSMTPDEKIEHILNNTTCVIRIVPTRQTSYTHLRDAFIRALQGRLQLGKANNTVDEELALEVATPIRELKTMFPNTPLGKGVPLDILLTPPAQNKPRSIVIRDLGAIEHSWVANQLFLHYFEGEGPSPPLKQTVVETLKS